MTATIPTINNIPGQNLAITAVDLLLSTASVDIVSILNGFSQVLQYARPVKATCRQSSRILDHPIETGQLISDYSIILPAEIDYTVIVQAQNYRSTCQEVIQIYQTKQILTVQLKTGNFINMVVSEIPHEETPDKFDAFMMTIKLRQVLIVQGAPPFMPANPAQANTTALGQQSATPATTVEQLAPGVTATGNDYSSVQNLSSSSYTISGVQTQSGVSTITNALPTTGPQTLTNTNSLSSIFGGMGGVPIGSGQ